MSFRDGMYVREGETASRAPSASRATFAGGLCARMFAGWAAVIKQREKGRSPPLAFPKAVGRPV